MKKYNPKRLPSEWTHIATFKVKKDKPNYEAMIESLTYLINADRKQLARIAADQCPDLDDVIAIAYRLKRYQQKRNGLILKQEN